MTFQGCCNNRLVVRGVTLMCALRVYCSALLVAVGGASLPLAGAS